MLDLSNLNTFILERVALYIKSLPSNELDVNEMPPHLTLIVQKDDDRYTLSSLVDMIDGAPDLWRNYAEKKRNHHKDAFGYVIWAVADVLIGDVTTKQIVVIINFLDNNSFFLLSLDATEVSEIDTPHFLPSYLDIEDIKN